MVDVDIQLGRHAILRPTAVCRKQTRRCLFTFPSLPLFSTSIAATLLEPMPAGDERLTYRRADRDICLTRHDCWTTIRIPNVDDAVPQTAAAAGQLTELPRHRLPYGAAKPTARHYSFPFLPAAKQRHYRRAR